MDQLIALFDRVIPLIKNAFKSVACFWRAFIMSHANIERTDALCLAIGIEPHRYCSACAKRRAHEIERTRAG